MQPTFSAVSLTPGIHNPTRIYLVVEMTNQVQSQMTSDINRISHLEDSCSFAHLLFVDFSSALNTLQPHLLVSRLNDFKVHASIIKWYFSFLTSHSQQVSVNGTLSETKTLSTGAPQGCVSSHVLFTLYTDACRSFYPNNHNIKFSDDTAILALLKNHSDLSEYFREIQRFIN